MPDKNMILVGKIVAPQGLRGEFRVQTYTENPMDFQKLSVHSPAFADGAFNFVRRLNPTSDMIVARVDGVNDRNAFESLRGAQLFIDRAALPATGADEYYVNDLIGMTISDANGTEFKVVDVKNFGAGDILELDNGEMLSFVGATVDMKNKTIKLDE